MECKETVRHYLSHCWALKDTQDLHSQHTDNNPSKWAKRRLAGDVTVVSRHLILGRSAELSLHCCLLQIKAFCRLWGRKRFLLPGFSLAYGWGCGRNLPTSPHRRLVNVPMVCVSSIGQLFFYSLIFMPVREGCFSPTWKSPSEGICCHPQALYVVTISYEARL